MQAVNNITIKLNNFKAKKAWLPLTKKSVPVKRIKKYQKIILKKVDTHEILEIDI